jgi:hypothetical protein
VVNNVVQVPNDAYNVSGTSIVFTSAPSAGTGNVYVRYLSTTTQSITPSQNTVSYATWDNDLRSETFAFKNRIINGAMMIDQRNAGASLALTGALYCLDRWQTQAAASSKLTAQQSSTAPAGFVNSLLFTVVGTASLGSTDTYRLIQKIEGVNVADLGWGTANAQTITISFWVRSSVTGTFGASIQNNDNNRSYPYTYTINAANTWEQKTVTIPGDTSGTWQTNTNTGLYLMWGLGVGSSLSGTAGAWVAGDFRSVTGATSLVANSGATWYITGVQLEKGSTATSFDYRPYGTELALCQRYFAQYQGDTGTYSGISGYAGSASAAYFITALPVAMRASPTGALNGTARFQSGTTDSANFTALSSTATMQTPFTSVLFTVTTSGMTTDSGGNLQFRANGSKLTFSAEL